ncbi:MAG TPA: L-serine ammonia-lyase [Candidatus Brocadiia bacterium]|nr:L-serine ammonia-lyase [Candidatus Brocadiia bacterium]
MAPITTSIFDLFKVGPGPSSSHTIAPMKAGADFLQLARALPAETKAAAASVQVTLFGSLAATGKGHGAERAVVAGLAGQVPETCDPALLDRMAGAPSEPAIVDLGGALLRLAPQDVAFDTQRPNLPFPNTLVIRLASAEGATLLEREYYSVGGGFLEWKGWTEPRRGQPAHPYANAAELARLLADKGMRLHELALENETAITGMRESAIYDRVDFILNVMDASVEAGLAAEGPLPGPLKVQRKARLLHERSSRLEHHTHAFLGSMTAYAFAASEENAAGHRVVTAPTCGAAGVMPAIARVMARHLHVPRQRLRESLLASAIVGFLIKHNASIAGAEVGCQGEVGSASSMAAAMLAYGHAADYRVAANAAEIAMEHHLGMTCDPVGGYVQIPCIERNAFGAVKAYLSFLIASTEVSHQHMVGLDSVIETMAETGRDIQEKYRETSRGGLAAKVKGR